MHVAEVSFSILYLSVVTIERAKESILQELQHPNNRHGIIANQTKVSEIMYQREDELCRLIDLPMKKSL